MISVKDQGSLTIDNKNLRIAGENCILKGENGSTLLLKEGSIEIRNSQQAVYLEEMAEFEKSEAFLLIGSIKRQESFFGKEESLIQIDQVDLPEPLTLFTGQIPTEKMLPDYLNMYAQNGIPYSVPVKWNQDRVDYTTPGSYHIYLELSESARKNTA